MSMSTDIRVIDPVMDMPGQHGGKSDDFVAWTVEQIDRHGIARAMPGVEDDNVARVSRL